MIEAFFYGLYMDRDLLISLGVHPMEEVVARLENYRLDLRGKIKAVPEAGSSVWGRVFKLLPQDLDSLYAGPATRDYRPERLQVLTAMGDSLPVSCYNLPEDVQAPLNTEYLAKLLKVAAKVGMPAEYIQTLESLAGR